MQTGSTGYSEIMSKYASRIPVTYALDTIHMKYRQEMLYVPEYVSRNPIQCFSRPRSGTRECAGIAEGSNFSLSTPAGQIVELGSLTQKGPVVLVVLRG